MLSEGQKSRIVFAIMCMKPHNMLLLDEPTCVCLVVILTCFCFFGDFATFCECLHPQVNPSNPSDCIQSILAMVSYRHTSLLALSGPAATTLTLWLLTRRT